MKIIIVGCGKIGRSMTQSLTSEGHDIVIIDNDPSVLGEVSDMFDVMGVCGNAVDCDTLNDAGAADADILVSTTDSDEVNMLACFLAKRLGTKHTAARIRNPEYNDQSLGFLRGQLDLSISLNPELLIAEEIANILQLPSAVRIERFSGRNVEMVELILPAGSPLDGMSLIKMRERYRADYLICTVRRGATTLIPDGRFELHAGDRIGLVAVRSEISKLLSMLGLLKRRAKSVMILGGGRPSYYLSKKLLSIGTDVKIIERDPEKCEFLASELQGAVIINGDGASQELLMEEGISGMDAFVSLTGMDEQNIMLSIFAATQSVPKVVSKISRDELLSMAQNLGVETIISPSQISTSIIVRYARALENSKGSGVETLYKIMGGAAEALEFKAVGNSRAVGTPLKDVRLKQNILIAGITRGRKTIIPSGNDMILEGDRVIVVSTNQGLHDLDDILA